MPSFGDLYTIGLPVKLFTLDDLEPKSRKKIIPPIDITEEMNTRFFCDIPKGHQIEWKHGVEVGKPGCGKSELFKFRAKYAYDKYGDDLNIIYTDDLRVGVEELKTSDKPVQYLIIDDATKHMSSRRAFDQAEVLGTFNRLRHHFRDYLKTDYGLILCEFGWQRWIDLDPGFRDGTSLIFKTSMTTYREKEAIAEIVGKQYMPGLEMIWDRIDRGGDAGNRAKSISIGRIGTRSPEHGGVGIYRSQLVNFPQFPEMILSDDYFDKEGNIVWDGKRHEKISDPLEKYRNDPGWSFKIEMYELSRKGVSQKKIGELYSSEDGTPLAQYTVSRYIRDVTDVLNVYAGGDETIA